MIDAILVLHVVKLALKSFLTESKGVKTMENSTYKAGAGWLLAVIVSVVGVTAQARDHMTPAAQEKVQAIGTHEFTEQKLDAFASAYIKIAAIYNRHAPQVKQARNSEQAYRAQMLIEDQMSQAIREEGMSPDEYNYVVRTINQDPHLGQKVAQKIRTLQ
ncbi:MAG: DUF4168 domain-containing protein [Gammaproteobacteria bacterium]|nr:DUF4168 domain-containing protein [Gammaproteobacteria bacterium]